MKKITFLKTLLVAVGLCVGSSSAWTQTTTTLLEYGTNDVAWSAESLAEWTAGGSPTRAADNSYVGISGKNGSYATSKTIAPTANSVINVTAVWRGRSNTGRAFSAGNGSYFRFGNIIVAQNDQDKKHGYVFTGLSNMKEVTMFTAGSYRVGIESCTWLLIEMKINTATNTVESFTIKSEDGTTTYVSKTDIVLADPDYTTVAFGYQKSGSVSTENAEQLKSVKITETTQEVKTADYTIKYVCGGSEVKEAVVRTSVVGSDIALIDGDKEAFYSNDKKYIYNGDGSEVSGKTVLEDGSEVIEVPFREAALWSWTANSDHGTFTTSGSTFEGDKVNVSYPLYVFEGGKLYTKAAINSTFNQQYDITADNTVYTLEYSDAEIEAIFYSEAEDVDGMTVFNSGNAAARSSQRAVGYTDDKVVFTTLPKGKYRIYVRFYSPTSAGGQAIVYAGNRLIVNEKVGNANATDLNKEFVLAKETNQIAFGPGGYTSAFDYVYIQSLGEATSEELEAAEAADHAVDFVSATIGATGYASFSSDYALDFSGVTELTAWKATACDGTKVTLEQVTGTVAAKTGLILKGASAEIPVVASGDAATGNLLQAVSDDMEVTKSATGTNYVLAKQSGNVVFAPITSDENSASVNKGQAFLYVAADVEAPYLQLVFADSETTGINDVISKTADVRCGVYNLNGQRVAKPTKGLYIVNGKKVIVK